MAESLHRAKSEDLRVLVIWRSTNGRQVYREVDAFDALSDVLVGYDVPTRPILREFKDLLMHPEYESKGEVDADNA